MYIPIYNLEDGRPTAHAARQALFLALGRAQQARAPAIKLIHGYGSSGQGGRLRAMVRRELREMKQRGEIFDFVKGEEFSPFEQAGQRAILHCFDLTRDCDYARCNAGVTVALL